jgi:hypothetical protein
LGQNLKYDVFGRLVETFPAPLATITRYRYNGLGYRIMTGTDANDDDVISGDEQYFNMYDERWRLVATFRNTDASAKEYFVHHNAGKAGRGGSSYIDSVILRDKDANTAWNAASDGVLEERRNYLQNWRADVVAIADGAGRPVEYVRYSSYGEAVAYQAADVNMDGSVTTADQTVWNSGSPSGDYAFGGDSDLNRDNVVDAADTTYFNASYTANTATSGKGWMSSLSVANRKGYAGYEYNVASKVWDPPEIARGVVYTSVMILRAKSRLSSRRLAGLMIGHGVRSGLNPGSLHSE